MTWVVLVEVFADDERRGHVDEARTHAIQQAVRQEHPLQGRHKGRGQAADEEHQCAHQPRHAVAVTSGQPDDEDGQRRARQRDAERESPDPV